MYESPCLLMESEMNGALHYSAALCRLHYLVSNDILSCLCSWSLLSRLSALEQPCESSTCHEISRIYTSVKVRDRCRRPECNLLNNVLTSDYVCRVNSFLGFVNLGEYCVQGVLEAYSCELMFLLLKQPAGFLLTSHILCLSSTCSRLFAYNR